MTNKLSTRNLLPAVVADNGSLARTPPASVKQLEKFKVTLMVAFKIPGKDVMPDPIATLRYTLAQLRKRGFSSDVLSAAIDRLVAKGERWLPAPAEVIEACNAIVKKVEEREEREAYQRRLENYERLNREKEERLQRWKEVPKPEKIVTLASATKRDREKIERAFPVLEEFFGDNAFSFFEAAERGEAWPALFIDVMEFVKTEDVMEFVKTEKLEEIRPRHGRYYFLFREISEGHFRNLGDAVRRLDRIVKEEEAREAALEAKKAREAAWEAKKAREVAEEAAKKAAWKEAWMAAEQGDEEAAEKAWVANKEAADEATWNWLLGEAAAMAAREAEDAHYNLKRVGLRDEDQAWGE